MRIGLSGGMSVLGTFASLVAAFALSFISMLFGALDIKLVIIAAVAAFLGSVFDSFLGSTVQIKYQCRVCNEITEKEEHCRKYTNRYSGFYFFDNDVVNLFSSAFAGILAAIIAAII